MKYEFHAGDYVEAKDGQIGYVTIFIHSHDGENTIFIDYKDGRTLGYKFPEDEPHRFFNRIGQYDFTKKDEGKIEKIDVKKAGSVFTGSETAIIDTISNKINELVEAVNELRER